MRIRDRIAARAWVGPSINPVPLSLAQRPSLLIVDNAMLTHGLAQLEALRAANPTQIVLAYVIGASLFPRFTEPPYALRRKFLERFNLDELWRPQDASRPACEFRVRRPDGTLVNFDGNFLGNMSVGAQRFDGKYPAEHFAEWAALDVWMTHRRLINGLYIDTWTRTIDWLGPLDLDGDGRAENATQVNALWEVGIGLATKTMRSLMGRSGIIIVNSPQQEWSWADGRFLEYAPAKNEPQGSDAVFGQIGSLDGNIRLYLSWCRRHFCGEDERGPFTVWHTKAEPTEYAKMRTGLAVALLGDGYYICDSTYTQGRNEVRWYDEYDLDIGEPEGPAQRYTYYWKRAYSGGAVYVNPTNVARTINVGTSYRKPPGALDPAWNNGAAITKLQLGPGEGAVLLRR